jgi:GNAT superfamily N-acetyltransferase
MDTPEHVEVWRQRVLSPEPYATFVALDEQDVVAAYCTVGVAELMAIYVDPARQRGGAGRAVHDAGIDHLIQHGFETAGLWVFTANSGARAFYAACGWIPDGQTNDDEIAGALIPKMRYVRQLRAAL